MTLSLICRQYTEEYHECLEKIQGASYEFNEIIKKASNEYVDKVQRVSREATCKLLKTELEKERADSPVVKKRELIYKMYPHLKNLCLGNIWLLKEALIESRK